MKIKNKKVLCLLLFSIFTSNVYANNNSMNKYNDISQIESCQKYLNSTPENLNSIDVYECSLDEILMKQNEQNKNSDLISVVFKISNDIIEKNLNLNLNNPIIYCLFALLMFLCLLHLAKRNKENKVSAVALIAIISLVISSPQFLKIVAQHVSIFATENAVASIRMINEANLITAKKSFSGTVKERLNLDEINSEISEIMFDSQLKRLINDNYNIVNSDKKDADLKDYLSFSEYYKCLNDENIKNRYNFNSSQMSLSSYVSSVCSDKTNYTFYDEKFAGKNYSDTEFTYNSIANNALSTAKTYLNYYCTNEKNKNYGLCIDLQNQKIFDKIITKDEMTKAFTDYIYKNYDILNKYSKNIKNDNIEMNKDQLEYLKFRRIHYFETYITDFFFDVNAEKLQDNFEQTKLNSFILKDFRNNRLVLEKENSESTKEFAYAIKKGNASIKIATENTKIINDNYYDSAKNFVSNFVFDDFLIAKKLFMHCDSVKKDDCKVNSNVFALTSKFIETKMTFDTAKVGYRYYNLSKIKNKDSKEYKNALTKLKNAKDDVKHNVIAVIIIVIVTFYFIASILLSIIKTTISIPNFIAVMTASTALNVTYGNGKNEIAERIKDEFFKSFFSPLVSVLSLFFAKIQTIIFVTIMFSVIYSISSDNLSLHMILKINIVSFLLIMIAVVLNIPAYSESKKALIKSTEVKAEMTNELEDSQKAVNKLKSIV